MKTQKLSHSISKFTPSLAIALLVAFAPYTSALPTSQYANTTAALGGDAMLANDRNADRDRFPAGVQDEQVGGGRLGQ